MRRLTFDAPLPWTPGSVYDWLIASIRGIRFRGEDVANSFCCSPANTINVRAVLGPNNSGLASIIFPTDVRAAVGLGVLFAHEARHNNGFPHTCPPFNDRTLSELGAWGVQYHLETYLSTRSDPAFISAAGRTGFMQAAQQTCGRFCDEGCP
jgi:hypothetical protein